MEKKKGFLHDIDWANSLPALIVVVALAIPAILYEQEVSALVNGFFNKFVEATDAFYISVPIILVGIGLYMAFSKYGKVVLGNVNERPAISNFTYIATLMAMCYGATIMRTGTIQWANIAAAPPFNIEPYTNEAILAGSAYSIFLWGLQLAAIYVITAPCVAYFVHVRNQNNVKISQMCRPLIGDKMADGIVGKVLDSIFIIALVLGAATTIGLATPVMSAVFAKLVGIESGFTLEFIMTIVMVGIFTTSAFLGIEKGIEKLSDLNVWLMIILIILIMVTGPGLFILNFSVDSIGEYINQFISFSFYTDSVNFGEVNATQSYTVFWWAYCFTWGIIQGIFTALISKGRTVKEVILYYFGTIFIIVVPLSCILGGMAVYSHLTGSIDVFAALGNGTGSAIAEILSVQKLAPIVMIIFFLLALIFSATTMDSTTYTMAAFASKADISKEAPSKGSRLFWAALMSISALAMMKVGGLGPLEVISGIAGLPIIIITFLVIFAGKKMMDQDKAYIKQIRPAGWDPETAPRAKQAEDKLV